MPEFRKVEHASVTPTACVACGTHQGPFLDFQVDVANHGRIYLCAGTEERPGCLRQAARLDGCMEPEQAEKLAESVVHSSAEIDQLRAELQELAKKKVVSVAEVARWFGATTVVTPSAGSYTVTWPTGV